MQLIKAHILVLTVLVFCSSELLAKDYAYFITDDGHVFLEATNADGTHLIRQEEIDKAKKAKDSRPAAEDPEGNWGAVVDGMQASIRFDKASFAPNEAINATVIIRNVGEVWHMFENRRGLASDVTIISPSQKQLERKDWAASDTHLGELQRIGTNRHGKAVFPGTQVKLLINLQEFYDFKAVGTYSINVKVKAYRAHSADIHYVQSANASITISNTPPPATNAVSPTAPK